MTAFSLCADRCACSRSSCEPFAFHRLLSVDPARNRFRFYVLTCEQTLWGEWAVRCTWGRIGSLGGSRIAYLGQLTGVAEALEGLLEHRIGRGYWPAGSPDSPPAS